MAISSSVLGSWIDGRIGAYPASAYADARDPGGGPVPTQDQINSTWVGQYGNVYEGTYAYGIWRTFLSFDTRGLGEVLGASLTLWQASDWSEESTFRVQIYQLGWIGASINNDGDGGYNNYLDAVAATACHAGSLCDTADWAYHQQVTAEIPASLVTIAGCARFVLVSSCDLAEAEPNPDACPVTGDWNEYTGFRTWEYGACAALVPRLCLETRALGTFGWIF